MSKSDKLLISRAAFASVECGVGQSQCEDIEMILECNCEKSSFGFCNPAAATLDGVEMLRKNQEYIGKFVCHSCGGISVEEPKSVSEVSGETIMSRLVELGIVKRQ